jgi:hypothetical protein
MIKIKGLPEGYDIVRIGRPEACELFIGGTGMVERSSGDLMAACYLIVRKIERPKQYRPFASAEEFKPHRDRWTRRIAYDPQGNDIYPPTRYSDLGYHGFKWQWCFENFSFDDGTPFGVEVSE